MEKEEIKRRIYKLRKERELLERHCLGIGKQLPLWLSVRYVRCGKKGCKCNKGQLHGPFNYFAIFSIFLFASLLIDVERTIFFIFPASFNNLL